MKKVILFLLILSGFVLAQDPPTSYTTHYRFGKWASGSNPGADSLNAQWDKIDNAIWGVADSTRDLYSLFLIGHTSSGYAKSGTITWDMLSTGAKSNMVQTFGAQTISGYKYFTSGLGFSGKDGIFVLPNESVGFNSTPNGMISYQDSLVYFYKSSTSRDTLASQRYVRSEIHDSIDALDVSTFVSLSGNQTITGNKTFSGYAKFKDLRLTPGTTTYDETINAGTLQANYSFTIITSVSGTSPTATDIDGLGVNGDYIIILNASSNTLTLENGTGNFKLSGGADYSLGANDTIELIYYDSYWYQVGGTHN